jgi:hypothetical protein
MVIAIGPVKHAPSWKWVGADTAKELSKSFDIKTFRRKPPEADVVIFIKDLPARVDRYAKIIYCPIDLFKNESHIRKHAKVLRHCDLILSHAESLISYFTPYAPTHLIEHHGKYTLPQMASYKEDGYVLWIGGYQFVPYVLHWMKKYPVPLDVHMLTDYKNPVAIKHAKTLAPRLQVRLKKLNLHLWSEKRQHKMMTEAKAAIDIKGDNFSQTHKPPTKAQKFISSGIPFATNAPEIRKYFLRRGFDVCKPNDERWLSREYWEQTQAFGQQLRQTISLESVGKEYQRHIKMLVGNKWY